MGHPAMQLLERHVPITLLCDLLDPPPAEELLAREQNTRDSATVSGRTVLDLTAAGAPAR